MEIILISESANFSTVLKCFSLESPGKANITSEYVFALISFPAFVISNNCCSEILFRLTFSNTCLSNDCTEAANPILPFNIDAHSRILGLLFLPADT